MNLIEAYPDIKYTAVFKNTSSNALCKYITESDFYTQKFSAGEVICSLCEKDLFVGIVISGAATVNSLDEGRNVLLRTIGVGAIFGIANLYAKELDFPTRISAKNACNVLFIKKQALRELIENDKNTLKSFLAFQSNKIVYLNKKINAFTAGSAERRLVLFLADNAVDGVYSEKISMSALAEMLDIGRASLYRALDKLEEDGCIERKGKSIIIKDSDLVSKKLSDRSTQSAK